MSAFRYSDDQWGEIRGTFQNLHTAHEDLVRKYLEECISKWLLSSPHLWQRTDAELHEISTAINILNRVRSREGGVGEQLLQPVWPVLAPHLRKIYNDIEAWATEMQANQAQSSYSIPLIDKLIKVWEAIDGETRTSAGPNVSPEDAPLFRFLFAAARPAGLDMTPHMTWLRIRSHRLADC